MPTYQPNVPTGTVDFDQDYLNLQGNFQQLDIAYGYDHVAFSDTSGLPPTVNGISGLHKVIHALANTVTSGGNPLNYPIVPPTPVGLTGEIFTTQSNDGKATDEILWYQTGGGRLSQLTSNIQPSSDAKRVCTYLPGGFLLQAGRINPIVPGTANAVTFLEAYRTTVFSVTASPRTTSTIGGGNHDWDIQGVTTTGFSIFMNGNYLATDTFYWFAIGF